jgi:hypothetical protein
MRRKNKQNKHNVQNEREAVVTIVEYSTQKQAVNAYPGKIVSPPSPSRCCALSTGQIGKIQQENGWPFVYQRCAVCGFTVRRLATHEDLLETIRTWRKMGRTASQPDAA